MRDYSLLLSLVVFTAAALRYPFAGVLTWEWLTIMNPHRLGWGIVTSLPLNYIVALATIAGMIFKRESIQRPKDALPILMTVLLLWMTINNLFAAVPDVSNYYLGLTVKLYFFAFVCLLTVNTMARFQAIIWVLVISMGFYGVKGGLFTIASGGSARVYGPASTIIGDNNQLALALVMCLPLMYYLYQTSANRYIRLGLGISIPVQVICVLGSYSRGGVIALLVMAGYFWSRTKRKVLYLGILVTVIAVGATLMPPAFYERMSSLNNVSADDSFMGRVSSWKLAYAYATDHFPFGFGFAGGQTYAVSHLYRPGEPILAAHSLYFEVLGDNGFIGLFLYLGICAWSIYNLRVVRRLSKDVPSLTWAFNLATMIEVGLVAFYVGGAALSMAYYDGLLMLQILSSSLRALVMRELEPAATTVPQRQRRHGQAREGQARVRESAPG